MDDSKEIKWPEPLKYYYSKKGYPENCVEAANRMLEKCNKAYEKRYPQESSKLVPLDENIIWKIKGELDEDNIFDWHKFIKTIVKKFGQPKQELSYGELKKHIACHLEQGTRIPLEDIDAAVRMIMISVRQEVTFGAKIEQKKDGK